MTDLFSHTHSDSASTATVRLDPSRRGEPVSATLFGKFGEHLYSPWNVSNVLEAQALFNPTFASWKFQEPEFPADGGRGAVQDPDEIADRIEAYVEKQAVPEADRLRDAYHDGAPLWWFPFGNEEAVTTSPDVGVAEDRAQRVEVDDPAAGYSGVAQWCHLPVHRTRSFECEVTLRAAEETRVRLAAHDVSDDGEIGAVLDEAVVTADGDAFETRPFELELPESATDEPDTPFGFSVATDTSEANVVVDRVCCYPDDHVATADPEVVDLLSELDLPVFRWPGGNFASGYHWRDGVGPVDERPAKPNPAWDAVETNLFGTDEFLALCEDVGCEPMICLNAGDGTAEEAARWVEYCNGDPETTEMGALRAEHGHPEPYDVTYWEVGNELYGPWQIGWTTPDGNADRFRRFKASMEAVDDSIEVFACGNRLTDWNDPLYGEIDADDWLTDHVLVECHAGPDTDPVELFNAHAGFAAHLGEQYREVARACREDGPGAVRQAITELQLFTRFDEDDSVEDRRIEAETLPTNKSITEAVFDATVINECIRTDTVEMVTHSGVGNHGGGLRKSRGRVWADPCYYGQRLGTGLIGGTPVGVDVECDTFSTETTFGADTAKWFGELPAVSDRPAVDAIAVTGADDHDVALLLVHCDAGADAIDVTVEAGDLFAGVDEATVDRLSAETMYERNTFDDPERVTPETERVTVADGGRLTVSLPPYSLVRVTADQADASGSDR